MNVGKRATPKQLATMLDQAAHWAYELTLGGVPPWMSAVGARIREPRDGDLVAETSTYYTSQRADRRGKRGHYPSGMRIGWLLRTAWEPIAMEWNEAEDGPTPTEPVTYIMGLDGKEHRWTNASFIAIPQESWRDTIVVDEEAVRRFQNRAA